MVRRNGSVKDAPRNMQSNQTGEHMQRYVAPRSTAVIAEQYSQGIFLVNQEL